MELDNRYGRLQRRSWVLFSARSSSEKQYGRRSSVSQGKPGESHPVFKLTLSLVKSLKTNSNPQAQYWAIVCLWQLSFDEEAASGLDK
jgi:hypothetical protein